MTDNNKNEMFLVLLETSGNQNYIFSTNKLRENIGASELTYQSGTKWVLDIVAKINQTDALKNVDHLRENLLNPELNPNIEDKKLGKPVEIIIATSGKALLITKDPENAKKIISNVTKRAIKEAPGLDICGVFVPFEWETQGSFIKAIKEVYKQFQVVHSKLPSSSMRFLQLPIVEHCNNSEFPASCLIPNPDATRKTDALSEVSYQKRQHSKESLIRFNKILENDQQKREFIEDVNKLEKKFEDLDWLAIIHADGNGLGQVFLNFQDYLDDPNDFREYINTLRKMSLALDVCTENAFKTALDQIETFKLRIDKNTEKQKVIPLIPLILGGDDLTVICDGKYALNFTKVFLEKFEKETGETQTIGEHKIDIIRTIAGKAFNGVKHLSACAGVAIIKPHFPFSVAYHLAEDLIKQAKQVKRIVTQNNNETQPYPCSAIDFHILYDSSDVDLKLIRKKLTINETTILHNRPYVITSLVEQLENAQGLAWVKFHHWDTLVDKVQVINTTDEEGKKELPSSQTHDLRSALFLGQEVANARYKLIKQRYPNLKELASLDNENSLFAKEPDTPLSKDKTVYTTGLLDAIDVSEFLPEIKH